jgi:hypothetical protein
MFNNLKKMITSENMLILKSLVVIGLVLFLIFGVTKENYDNTKYTKWAGKAYQLPWEKLGKDSQLSYDRVMGVNVKDRKKQYREEKIYYLNQLISKAREDGKDASVIKKLQNKVKKIQNKR